MFSPTKTTAVVKDAQKRVTKQSTHAQVFENLCEQNANAGLGRDNSETNRTNKYVVQD
jgi:hypothetical protein